VSARLAVGNLYRRALQYRYLLAAAGGFMADEWLRSVSTPTRSLDDLERPLGRARVQALKSELEVLRATLGRRRIININTSMSGGGAAEMLRDLIPYVRDAGIDCRWIAVGGAADFYTITKRIHYRMYGFAGDGGPLGVVEQRCYEKVHAAIADQVAQVVRSGDLVLLHDPQPLGLAPWLAAVGARTVWRCHIGRDQPNEYTDQAWSFLRRYLELAEAYVFHRRQFAPTWLDKKRVVAIAPSIEPLAIKNRPISNAVASEILAFCGLRQGRTTGKPIRFSRRQGGTGVVQRPADVLQSGPPAPADVPLVAQISRWDPMKDMRGVMTAFADSVGDMGDSHLMLAGPSISATSDDPYGAEILLDCMSQWRRLPYQARARIHLVCLSMADIEENALVVNAVQRQANIIVQKSLAEGFGLTVAEAMWKSRPVVASAVGGIRDQIAGESGILVDPEDSGAFGSALGSLARSPAEQLRMGVAAKQRIFESYMPDRHLIDFAKLFRVVAETSPG
jgi:trehalose synthase